MKICSGTKINNAFSIPNDYPYKEELNVPGVVDSIKYNFEDFLFSESTFKIEPAMHTSLGQRVLIDITGI